MKLRYDDISSVTIQPYEKMNLTKMSNIFSKMIENDLHFIPTHNSVPGIWKCRWYNDQSLSTTSQYSAGDVVWMNTEDPQQFVKNFANDILDCIRNNVELNSRYIDISSDQNAVFQLCYDIAFGLNGHKALYCIGDISKPAQIRIALSDTIEPPTNNTYWTDFLEPDAKEINRNKINASLIDQYAEQLSNHINSYHLSNEFTNQSLVDDVFLKKDFSNIQYANTYSSHLYPNEQNGVDVPKLYVTRQFDGLIKWFRLWQSGLLEHGGIVDVTRPNGLDSIEYNKKFYKVVFNWPYSEGTAPIYDYLRISELDFYRKGLNIKTDVDSVKYDYSQTCDPQSRYTISITPLLTNTTPDNNLYEPYTDGKQIGIKEITDVKNSSFCFKFNSNSTNKIYKYYSYYVRGLTTLNVRRYSK